MAGSAWERLGAKHPKCLEPPQVQVPGDHLHGQLDDLLRYAFELLIGYATLRL